MQINNVIQSELNTNTRSGVVLYPWHPALLIRTGHHFNLTMLDKYGNNNRGMSFSHYKPINCVVCYRDGCQK